MSHIISFALLILISSNTLSFGQGDHRNKIAWLADRPLTWDDFKQKKTSSGGMKAITDAGIAIWFDCDGAGPKVVAKCFFDKSGSWTKTPDNLELLKHEQLHFDITELFTRKLRMKLAILEAPCGQDSNKVQGIYDQNFAEMNKYQKRYDRETNHSMKEAPQIEWEEKVKQDLEDFKAFAST